MISSLKATSGYAAELEGLKDRTFEFPPEKINILYGPNGSGKTTILKMLAAYTGIDHSNKNWGGGGWSNPNAYGLRWNEKPFPDAFSALTPGQCAADVTWDGVPAFYNSATLGDDPNMSFMISDPSDSPDGLMDGVEQLRLITGHHSEGELRAFKTSKVVKEMMGDKKPKPYIKPKNDVGKEYAAYVRSLRGRKRKCVWTLLWDEPDRSLSIDNQIRVWMEILPNMFTDDLQIVIATHSAIVPLLPDLDFYNIIDVTEGYVDGSRQKLVRIMGVRLKQEGDAE
jgi:hypothetical protein